MVHSCAEDITVQVGVLEAAVLGVGFESDHRVPATWNLDPGFPRGDDPTPISWGVHGTLISKVHYVTGRDVFETGFVS